MKIAIFGRFRKESSNGIDRTIQGHLAVLRDLGYSVDLWTLSSPRPQDQPVLDSMGIQAKVFPSSLIKLYLAAWKDSRKYDIVMVHSVFTPANWILVAALRCRWTITPHGGYSPGQIAHKRKFLKNWAIRLFEKRMLEKALLVQALAEREAKDIRKIAPRSRVVVAPNGSVSNQHPLPFAVPRGDCLRLIFVGRVEYMHKGLDRLVAEVVRFAPGRIRLDIVGPGEPQEVEFLKAVARGSIGESSVFFHGPLYGEEKLALLSLSHVFVHTSRWEGMPFSIIEALQLGRPVLVTPETNMAELVNAYDAGWVVDGDEIYSGLNAILTISDNILQVKAENARRLALEQLSWKNVGPKLFGELESVFKEA